LLTFLIMAGVGNARRGEPNQRTATASPTQFRATLQDLVLGRKEGERLRETGHRSPFRMTPARAGMWVNGTHLTWRQLSILFGRQRADEVVESLREGHRRLEAEGA
jgi:hypothetical protein